MWFHDTTLCKALKIHTITTETPVLESMLRKILIFHFVSPLYHKLLYINRKAKQKQSNQLEEVFQQDTTMQQRIPVPSSLY